MVLALLIAGIGLLLAGLLQIAFGIPVKEFSFGNTLMLTGTITACTGVLLTGFWVAVRELTGGNFQLRTSVPAPSRPMPAFPTSPADAFAKETIHDEEGDVVNVSPPKLASDGAALTPPAALPPWHEDTTGRDRARSDVPPPVTAETAAPITKQRRNLLFSSTSRKERERAEARMADPSLGDLPAATPEREAPPATFEEAWPQTERARPAAPEAPPRRNPRPAEPASTPVTVPSLPGRSEEQAPVTVLKSGVVDGMAYSLYSDGSIEAQMPEGMMRFASIDELRSHLDQRN